LTNVGKTLTYSTEEVKTVCSAICLTPRFGGIPLDWDTLDRMSLEEERFWMDFSDQARQEIQSGKRTEKGKIIPSTSLKAKYRRAISQYQGEGYCPVKQLEVIFDFSD
jgi:hypothetical protein